MYLPDIEPMLLDVSFQFAHSEDRLRELHLNIHSVPRSKHSFSFMKTNQLMQYREVHLCLC